MVDLVVVVASSEALVSSALARMLHAEAGWTVVESAAQGSSDIDRACREVAASVVIVDVVTETAVTQTVIEGLRRDCPARGIVAIVSAGPGDVAAQMFTAGAHGVVVRDAAPAELVAAVREVADGHFFASRTAMRLLLMRLAEDSSAHLRRWAQMREQLSGREREAVMLLAQGMTNQEIARSMLVSEGPVKAHLSRVMSKWGVRDRVQLVIRALGAAIPDRDDT